MFSVLPILSLSSTTIMSLMDVCRSQLGFTMTHAVHIATFFKVLFY